MRKAFNVTKKDFCILQQLDKQVNMSQYIISLIKQDMKQEKVKNKIPTEEQIIELIKKYSVVSDGSKKSSSYCNDFPIDSVMQILE